MLQGLVQFERYTVARRDVEYHVCISRQAPKTVLRFGLQAHSAGVLIVASTLPSPLVLWSQNPLDIPAPVPMRGRVLNIWTASNQVLTKLVDQS